jgi:hypothetical protein
MSPSTSDMGILFSQHLSYWSQAGPIELVSLDFLLCPVQYKSKCMYQNRSRVFVSLVVVLCLGHNSFIYALVIDLYLLEKVVNDVLIIA